MVVDALILLILLYDISIANRQVRRGALQAACLVRETLVEGGVEAMFVCGYLHFFLSF